MKFCITPKDIQYGNRCSCFSCPVGRSVGRRGYNLWVDFRGDKMRCYVQIGRRRCYLPARIQTWIRDFDSYIKVKPTSFTLEI